MLIEGNNTTVKPGQLWRVRQFRRGEEGMGNGYSNAHSLVLVLSVDLPYDNNTIIYLSNSPINDVNRVYHNVSTIDINQDLELVSDVE